MSFIYDFKTTYIRHISRRLSGKSIWTSFQLEATRELKEMLGVCKPLTDHFSSENIEWIVNGLHAGDFEGVQRLIEAEYGYSNRPWCVEYIKTAISAALTNSPPDVLEGLNNLFDTEFKWN
jgi:hypothetical protein